MAFSCFCVMIGYVKEVERLEGCMGLCRLFRMARMCKGLTQEDVGRAVCLTGNAYGKIENGRRGLSLDLVGPLCRLLDVSVEEAMSCLTGASDGPPEPSTAGSSDVLADCRRSRSFVFTDEEAAVHMAIAGFLGLDPLGGESFLASGPVIKEGRRRRAAGKKFGRGGVPVERRTSDGSTREQHAGVEGFGDPEEVP